MRLLWSSRSPFARKVVVGAHELGIVDRLTLERVVVATDQVNPSVLAQNPLNQIPTLILDDGTVVLESGVILDFLDTRFGGGLLPAGEARWDALRTQALGDGLAQLNRARLAESRRGAAASAPYRDAFAAKTTAVLDRLDREVPILGRLSVGSIAAAVALAHLDFRFPEEGWRSGREPLAAWHLEFCRRESMRATEPADVY